MLIQGKTRKFVKNALGNGVLDQRMTQFESLPFAQVEPINLETTRAGARFGLGNSAAITGIAPVGALPTTQPQWVIFNAEPANNGKTYWFEELGMFLTSGTPGVSGLLLACIFSAPVPVGGNAAGCSVAPYGKPGANAASTNQGSAAVVKSSPAVITTPANPTWFVLADNQSPNIAAFPGSVLLEHRFLEGALALPPQTGLGLAVVAPAGTTPLFAPFGRWLELQSDNE